MQIKRSVSKSSNIWTNLYSYLLLIKYSDIYKWSKVNLDSIGSFPENTDLLSLVLHLGYIM
jgi:hypothetical protein